VLPTSFLRIHKTHNRTSLQVWHANVLYFCSFCKQTFSGATREWDALYMYMLERPHTNEFSCSSPFYPSFTWHIDYVKIKLSLCLINYSPRHEDVLGMGIQLQTMQSQYLGNNVLVLKVNNCRQTIWIAYRSATDCESAVYENTFTANWKQWQVIFLQWQLGKVKQSYPVTGLGGL
jgi:hypothetical protein